MDDPAIQPIAQLVDTLDQHVQEPERLLDAPFLMPAEGICTISGRGTVVTGRVEAGAVAVGDGVEIVGLVGDDATPRRAVVTGTQAFHRDVPRAEAGMNVGLLLRGIKRDEIARGQVLAAPGSVRSHRRGRAEFFSLWSEEGGRKKPFAVGYEPQFFFGATSVTGAVVRIDGTEHVMPGDRVTLDFELQKPVGIQQGMRFATREGGRTVGAGLIVETW